MTSSIRSRAAPMRWRQTAISSVARATRSARRSTSTSLPSSSRRMPSSSSRAWAYPGAAVERGGGGVHGVSLSSGSARLRNEPEANWVVRTSPAATSAGDADETAVGGAGDAPPAGQDVDGIERPDAGLDRHEVALLGGEQLRGPRRPAGRRPRAAGARRRSADGGRRPAAAGSADPAARRPARRRRGCAGRCGGPARPACGRPWPSRARDSTTTAS